MAPQNQNKQQPRASKRSQRTNMNQQRTVASVPRQGLRSKQQTYMTGQPKFQHKGDRVIVSNSEILVEVNGTVASGVIPAGGAIRVFRFENVATGNNMNTTRWLTGMAKLYDKFRVNKMNMRWVTSVPFTYGGQVALRFDSDPSKTTADASLLAVSGDMRALATAVYNSASNRVKKDQLNRLPQYETFPNAADTGVATVGSINLAYSAITPPAGTTGTINLGYVWVDYEVEFFNPSNAIAA